MLGNDGGVYFTYDGATHWDFIDNLPIGQFYDIAIDYRDPYWIYGGAQDNGHVGVSERDVLARRHDECRRHEHSSTAMAFRSAVDPTDPRFVYTNSQNGRGYLVDLVTREEQWITPVPPTPRSSIGSTGTRRFSFRLTIRTTYYYGAQQAAEDERSRHHLAGVEPGPHDEPGLEEAEPRRRHSAARRTTLSRDDGIERFRQHHDDQRVAESAAARSTSAPTMATCR